VRVGGIKQLQSFEHCREWRDLTHDKLTIGIGFHTRTLPALPPLVSVYRFPTICSEAVCLHTAYQIVVARRRRRLLSAQYWAQLLRKVLGQYQYWQVLANTQYPNTSIVRTLLLTCLQHVWISFSCTKTSDMISWPTLLESVIDMFMKCLHNSTIYNLSIFRCGLRSVHTCVRCAL